MVTLPLDGGTGAWDEFVTRAAESSFCHLAGWRDVLSDALGAECLYRVATDRNGECQGVLPLARIKSRIFGHYLVSLPFLNYGGPLGSAAARRQLAQEAVAEARRSSAPMRSLDRAVCLDSRRPFDRTLSPVDWAVWTADGGFRPVPSELPP